MSRIEYLRRAVGQVAVERFAGGQVVPFSEAKVNQDRNILDGQQNISRPNAAISNKHEPRRRKTHLMSL